MKKRICLTIGCAILMNVISYGQNSEFEEILLPDVIENGSQILQLEASDLDVADVDDDGDMDFLIIGSEGSTRRTKLYLNDGTGNFVESMTSTFIPVTSGSVDFADVDGDDDPDVFITGSKTTSQRSSVLYLNDGGGIFTEVIGTPFLAVLGGEAAFADIDGDEDEDLILTGYSGSFITKVYINDGSGGFTEDETASLTGVYSSSLGFADVDGDEDLDLLLTGAKSFSNDDEYVAELYLNDGSGNFTKETGTPFTGVSGSAVVFGELDGNIGVDVIISGLTNTGTRITRVYTNDGIGSFTYLNTNSITGTWGTSIALDDLDNDTDLDFILSGKNESGVAFTKSYLNNGSAIFTEGNEDLIGLFAGDIALVDIDGDLDKDLICTGESGSELGVTRLYVHDSGTFKAVNETHLLGMYQGQMDVSDIDGDGDTDILQMGQTLSDVTSIFSLNDGSGNFTELETPFENGTEGSLMFFDIDGDNDEDVLITGSNAVGTRFTKLYRRTGDAVFEEVLETPFEGVNRSALAVADVDGDEDLDVLISGQNNEAERIIGLYINDGNGIYTEDESANLTGGVFGDVEFVDVDGDDDPDLFVTLSPTGGSVCKLYINDGAGNFTEDESLNLLYEALSFGSAAFVDVDGDDDLDLLFSGTLNSSFKPTYLYKNDGAGNFTAFSSLYTFGSPYVTGSFRPDMDFSDVDKDGDQDLLFGAKDPSGDYTTRLYTNNGDGNFTESISFEGVNYANIRLVDLDGDGYEEAIVQGLSNALIPITKVYRNEPYLGTVYYVSNPGQGLQDGSTIANAAPKVSSVIDGVLLRDSVKVVSGTVTETVDFTIPKNVHVWLGSDVSLDAGAQTLTNSGHVTLLPTASFVQSTGTVTGEGSFEVMRQAGTEFGLYNLLTSPVQDIDVQKVYGGSNVVTYDPAQQDNGAGGWTFLYSGVLKNGKGYAVNGSLSSNFAGLRHYIGQPNNGDIAFTLDGNSYGEVADGWNLLGNPYPSAIDMTAFLTSNADVGAVTLYDQSAEMYVTYNLFNSAGLSIASGQGFFVEFSLASSGTATFTNTHRQQLAGTIERKSSIATATLNLQNEQGIAYNTLVGFAGEASDGFDIDYDAKLMPGASEVLVYSLLDEIPQTIQGFSTLEAEKVVPIGIKGNAGNYVFVLDDLAGMDGVEVLLLDAETGVVHNIKANEYSFLHAFDGADNNRFSLIFRLESLDIPDIILDEISVFISGDLLNITGGNLQVVTLYDATGKQLLHENVSGDRATLSVIDFVVGVYFVEVGSGNYQVRKKVQIVK